MIETEEGYHGKKGQSNSCIYRLMSLAAVAKVGRKTFIQ
jgi:hypothetical protein